MNGINKDFIEELRQKHPKAVDFFIKWIRRYKVSIKWKTKMFKTKFLDLPLEMQYGVILQFILEQKLMTAVYLLFEDNQKNALSLTKFKQTMALILHKLENQLNKDE